MPYISLQNKCQQGKPSEMFSVYHLLNWLGNFIMNKEMNSKNKPIFDHPILGILHKFRLRA